MKFYINQMAHFLVDLPIANNIFNINSVKNQNNFLNKN